MKVFLISWLAVLIAWAAHAQTRTQGSSSSGSCKHHGKITAFKFHPVSDIHSKDLTIYLVDARSKHGLGLKLSRGEFGTLGPIALTSGSSADDLPHMNVTVLDTSPIYGEVGGVMASVLGKLGESLVQTLKHVPSFDLKIPVDFGNPIPCNEIPDLKGHQTCIMKDYSTDNYTLQIETIKTCNDNGT